MQVALQQVEWSALNSWTLLNALNIRWRLELSSPLIICSLCDPNIINLCAPLRVGGTAELSNNVCLYSLVPSTWLVVIHNYVYIITLRVVSISRLWIEKLFYIIETKKQYTKGLLKKKYKIRSFCLKRVFTAFEFWINLRFAQEHETVALNWNYFEI